MSVTAESVASPSYFRLQVARGHLGRGQTEYEARYVSTFMPVADLYANHGKAIAGIKRVTAVSPVTRDEFEAARQRGENCFHARPRL